MTPEDLRAELARRFPKGYVLASAIPLPPPEVSERQKKRAWWRATAEKIEAASVAIVHKIEQGVQAASVITSGPATAEEIATRRASCSTCPSRNDAPDGLSYCGACGCGMNRWSRLDVKITLAECPCELGRPGFFGSPPSTPAVSDASGRTLPGKEPDHGNG